MTQKEAFEAWYYEVENYCLRAERMAIPFEDAEAAFDAGWQAAKAEEKRGNDEQS